MTYNELKNNYNQDYRDIKDLIKNCLYYGYGLTELKNTNLIKSINNNNVFDLLVRECKAE